MKYYLYLFDGIYRYQFSTYEALINYLSFGNITQPYKLQYYRHGNRFFEDMACSVNDTRGDDPKTGTKVRRTSWVFDEYGRNIFNHELITDVLHHKYVEPVRTAVFDDPHFRQLPVPHTKKIHWRKAHSIHTQNERRQCAAPQMKRFNRPKRGMNLPTNWDAPPIHIERNWKKRGKYLHQWEQHATSK